MPLMRRLLPGMTAFACNPGLSLGKQGVNTHSAPSHLCCRIPVDAGYQWMQPACSCHGAACPLWPPHAHCCHADTHAQAYEVDIVHGSTISLRAPNGQRLELDGGGGLRFTEWIRVVGCACMVAAAVSGLRIQGLGSG